MNTNNFLKNIQKRSTRFMPLFYESIIILYLKMSTRKSVTAYTWYRGSASIPKSATYPHETFLNLFPVSISPKTIWNILEQFLELSRMKIYWSVNNPALPLLIMCPTRTLNWTLLRKLNHFYKLFQDENGLMEVVYIMKQLIHCFKYV